MPYIASISSINKNPTDKESGTNRSIIKTNIIDMIDFTNPYVYIIGIILLYVIIMILKVLIRTYDKRANDNIYKDYPSKGRKD